MARNTFENNICFAKIPLRQEASLAFTYSESLAFQHKISLMIHPLNPALEARHSKVWGLYSKFNYMNLRFCILYLSQIFDILSLDDD